MKTKYVILTLLSCFLTVITTLVFHGGILSDSPLYLHLAHQYSEFNFLDPVSNYYGRHFYAVFLAIIGTVISYNYIVIGIMQTLLFCLSSFILVKELEKYLNKNLLGLLLLLFLVPEIHFYNGSVFTESLGYSLIILVFAFALKIHNGKSSVWNILVLSSLIGFTILNRMECGVCIIPAFYLIFPQIKDKLIVRGLVFISIPIFLLLLNGYQNYKIYNIFKVTALNGGEVIFGGNNENLDGSYHRFGMYKEIFIPKDKIEDFTKIESLPPFDFYRERDSLYLIMAKDAWRKDPIKQLGVIPEKFCKTWLLPGFFDIYTADTTKTRGLQLSYLLSKENFHNAWYAPYKHLFYIIIHWLLLLMILWGIFQIKRSNRFQISILFLLILYVLFSIPFCSLPRYHVTLFPILIIAFTPFSLINKLNNVLKAYFGKYFLGEK